MNSSSCNRPAEGDLLFISLIVQTPGSKCWEQQRPIRPLHTHPPTRTHACTDDSDATCDEQQGGCWLKAAHHSITAPVSVADLGNKVIHKDTEEEGKFKKTTASCSLVGFFCLSLLLIFLMWLGLMKKGWKYCKYLHIKSKHQLIDVENGSSGQNNAGLKERDEAVEEVRRRENEGNSSDSVCSLSVSPSWRWKQSCVFFPQWW